MDSWQIVQRVGEALSLGGLGAAALHDVAVRTVPNRVSTVVCVGALLDAWASDRLLAGVLTGLCALAACAFLWLRGWMGGGDAKLLAAASPLVTPVGTLDLALAVAVAGGLLAMLYLPGSRLFTRPGYARPCGLFARLLKCERWRLSRRGPLPYAVAIAAGVCLVIIRKE